MAASNSFDGVSYDEKESDKESIQEEEAEVATVNGDETDEGGFETMDVDDLVKRHVFLRFNASGGQTTNVAFLLKEVFKWLVDLYPNTYIETANDNWKIIQSIDDFPTKVADFLKCFAPSNAKGGSGALLIGFHLHSTLSIEKIKQLSQPFLRYLMTKISAPKPPAAAPKTKF
jgi:hypothetical protein